MFGHVVLESQKPIVYFLNKFAHKKPVYFFESILNFEYPSVDYAGAIHCSRFPYLLWMPAYLREYAINPDSEKTAELTKINTYFVDLMSKDMIAKKPQYIFVDASKSISTPIFNITNFNYLTFFLTSPEFRTAWKSYHYFATINAEPYYKLDIYTLNATKPSPEHKK